MVEKLIMINWGYVLILFLLGFLTYKRKIFRCSWISCYDCYGYYHYFF